MFTISDQMRTRSVHVNLFSFSLGSGHIETLLRIINSGSTYGNDVWTSIRNRIRKMNSDRYGRVHDNT